MRRKIFWDQGSKAGDCPVRKGKGENTDEGIQGRVNYRKEGGR